MLVNNHGTYNRIRSTFVCLLSDSSYAKLSVTDIAEKAGVSRQTFYLHFSSKEELALSFLDEIFDDFFIKIEPKAITNDNHFVMQSLYETYRDSVAQWCTVRSCNIEAATRKRYKRYVSRVMGNIVRRNQEAFSDAFYLECLVAHLACSAHELACLWLENDMKLPPAEMAEIHIKLINRDLPQLVADLGALSKQSQAATPI